MDSGSLPQAVKTGVFADENLESIQGELVLMPPEGVSHIYYSDRFAKLLQRLLQGRAQVREGRPINLPDDSEPQPTGDQQKQMLRTGTIASLSFPEVVVEVEMLFRR